MKTILLSEANKAVSFIDGELYIGGHKVIRQESTCEGQENVPAWYTIRVMKDGWLQLCTTMDLMKDGYIWLCSYDIESDRPGSFGRDTTPSAFYDDFAIIEYILNNLCKDTKGLEWSICEEEDFDKAFEDWDDCDID